jgi:hypothetical protein
VVAHWGKAPIGLPQASHRIVSIVVAIATKKLKNR